jgi:hypothetical protein
VVGNNGGVRVGAPGEAAALALHGRDVRSHEVHDRSLSVQVNGGAGGRLVWAVL